VNLLPHGVRKVGAGLDLAIAVGLLVADGQLDRACLAGRAFLGELGLDGTVRPVPGVVPLVEAVPEDEVVVAAASAADAGLVGRHVVRAAVDLRGLVLALEGKARWPGAAPVGAAAPAVEVRHPDLSDVVGQAAACRALEIAAAGGHHLLLVGARGAGKTMLARRLPGLLPDLPPDQAFEVAQVVSATGQSLPPVALLRRPPFRSPHHGRSAVSLLGGAGSSLLPGEVSLAHRGILFLDDLDQFPPAVLDCLRLALDDGAVRVARATTKAMLPARVQLVGATVPCLWGDGGSGRRCVCSPGARLRHARRVTGPLLDRFDLRVELKHPDDLDDAADTPPDPTGVVASLVAKARERATARGVPTNADLPAERLTDEAPMGAHAIQLAEHAVRTGRLTGRGLHAVRRVALTIADLNGDELPLTGAHIAEALTLRTTPSFAHRSP
jgi:magnesium chelatase family protein